MTFRVTGVVSRAVMASIDPIPMPGLESSVGNSETSKEVNSRPFNAR